MGTDMDLEEFRKEALLAADNVFVFAGFANRSESFFDNVGLDPFFVQRYRKAWFELEIVNAVALEEWESDGRPPDWAAKWLDKYRVDASDVIQELMQVVDELAYSAMH